MHALRFTTVMMLITEKTTAVRKCHDTLTHADNTAIDTAYAGSNNKKTTMTAAQAERVVRTGCVPPCSALETWTATTLHKLELNNFHKIHN